MTLLAVMRSLWHATPELVGARTFPKFTFSYYNEENDEENKPGIQMPAVIIKPVVHESQQTKQVQ